MTKSQFRVVAWIMVVVAAAAYINNVIVFPGLRAPDGFGHFTYIWSLASTGSVPRATEGWSFFHPPLYYAFMAGVWNVFSALNPVVRLNIGTGVIALLGITQAGVAYLIVRRCLPTNYLAQLLAIGVMLLLPLQLFSAGYIGNERLNAVFCGTSILALLWVLDRPIWSRALVLGLLLGLALLVKFTALAIVAASFATIFLSFLFRREFIPGLKVLVVVAIATLSVCGWFYARNIIDYGTPFKLSRDTDMVQRVENYQTAGDRSLLEYVLFDPLIIASPQWPRGLPLFGNLPDDIERSALRESVWTGVYANAWFDGVGGIVIPPISHNSVSLHSGQLILALALVPTLLVLVGICTSILRLWRDGWSDVYAAMLISFAAMMTVFIYGTKVVPLHAAIKASYLTPASVVFAFWLAIGFDTVSRNHKWAMRGAVAVCAVLALLSVSVFSLGVVVGRDYLRGGLEDRVWQNVYGVVQYAGGQKARALEMFQASASKNWSLGHENVAAMALEAGRPRTAVLHLKAAIRFQARQSFGRPADRQKFDDATQAELGNLLAVAQYRSGALRAALQAAQNAVARNQAIPEANYNLGILQLIESLSLSEGDVNRRTLIESALDQFQAAWDADPAFRDAMDMRGAADALLGDCRKARSSFEKADAIAPGTPRSYPHETGPGDMHSAGLHRRLRIRKIPERIDSSFQRRRCMAQGESVADPDDRG